MQVTRSVEISAPIGDVWAIVSDIEHSDSIISGIKKVEILEPAKGPSIVGLKWRETREMMGKDAAEVMWITDAAEASYYETRAESHGSIYTSRIALETTSSGTKLTMDFIGQPVTFTARLLWSLTGWIAKSALRKTIDKDLDDIKHSAEKARS
ncbi:MAG: SRPBCC family protein [Gammaproteobacteria bacterium]|nr:SRPBCC family protein [Gammaproteobacteria bacterium]